MLKTYSDLRYRGQSSEITVPSFGSRVTAAALRETEERFEQEFERTYGHRGESRELELVNCRMKVEHVSSMDDNDLCRQPVRTAFGTRCVGTGSKFA